MLVWGKDNVFREAQEGHCGQSSELASAGGCGESPGDVGVED